MRDEPAFPRPASKDDLARAVVSQDGLTKREWFAGLALQGLAAVGNGIFKDESAKHAVALADALCKELEK